MTQGRPTVAFCRSVAESKALAAGARRVMDGGDAELPARPRTRADCIDGPRPCPWVSCWHHALLARLLLGNGLAPKTNDAAVEVLESMPASCVLDVVDAAPDGATLDVVGGVLGVCRERVRQIDEAARAVAMARARRSGLDGEVTERNLDDVEAARPTRSRVAVAFAETRAPAPPPPHHAHLPGPADVAPGADFWCGHIGAAVTTRLCQGRRTATWAAQGRTNAPAPVYPACAACPDGAALAARLTDLPAPPAPERRRLPVIQPTEPTTMTTKTTETTETKPCAAKGCDARAGRVREDTNPAVADLCIRDRKRAHDRGRTMEGGVAAAAQALRDGTLPAPDPVRSAMGRKSGKARAAKAPRPAIAKPAPRPAPEKRAAGPVDGLALVRRRAAVVARLGGIDAAEALADELAQIGGAA